MLRFALLMFLASSAQASELESLKKAIAVQQAQIESLKPGPWVAIKDTKRVFCRRSGGWIEFRGRWNEVFQKSGGDYKGRELFTIPKECGALRRTLWTSIGCQANYHEDESKTAPTGASDERPRNSVCHLDILGQDQEKKESWGMVRLYLDFKATDLRFEGLRIWAGN